MSSSSDSEDDSANIKAPPPEGASATTGVTTLPMSTLAEVGENIADPSPPTAGIMKAALKAAKEAEKEQLVSWEKG
jgi:hypothetical protein